MLWSKQILSLPCDAERIICRDISMKPLKSPTAEKSPLPHSFMMERSAKIEFAWSRIHKGEMKLAREDIVRSDKISRLQKIEQALDVEGINCFAGILAYNRSKSILGIFLSQLIQSKTSFCLSLQAQIDEIRSELYGDFALVHPGFTYSSVPQILEGALRSGLDVVNRQICADPVSMKYIDFWTVEPPIVSGIQVFEGLREMRLSLEHFRDISEQHVAFVDVPVPSNVKSLLMLKDPSLRP